jgi:hypothetical protein
MFFLKKTNVLKHTHITNHNVPEESEFVKNRLLNDARMSYLDSAAGLYVIAYQAWMVT